MKLKRLKRQLLGDKMTIQRNKIRKYTNGEIFTPIELVNEILDKLPKEYFTDSSKTICEPSVGEGIFLVEILRRRLDNGLSSTESLKTLYGLDIMEDNISVCKQNLLELSGDCEEHRMIVNTNIRCENTLKYDFSFKEKDSV